MALTDWVLHDVTDLSGPPHAALLSVYQKVYPKAAIYAVVFIMLWLITNALLRIAGFGEKIGDAPRGSWALKTAILIHHTFVGLFATYGMWQDTTIRTMFTCFGCSSVAAQMNRDSSPCMFALALTPVTLGYFIGDLILLSNWSLTSSAKVENMLMIFHHVASLIVWPAAIYFDWVSRYVLVMLSLEFSTIWLTLMWMLGMAGYKKSKAYLVVGAIFTLSFVMMRMVAALPQFRAMSLAPPWSPAIEQAAGGPTGIHHLSWVFSLSLVFPHLLNLFWGVKVVNGFLGVLKKSVTKKDS